MIKCKKCLYTSNHPFGLNLNKDGLCTGCLTHLEKYNLDWEKRFILLQNKVNAFKKKNNDYDCIVPIRGTPEYFYLLDIIINKLNLNPLVVSYNSQFNSNVGIKNLDLIRETFDVDIIHYTSNPIIYKKLIRESLSSLNSIRWPFLAGETQFPVKIAIEKKIQLIIWPYYQPNEQVGLHSYLEEAEMSRRSRHEFDLLKTEPLDFINVGSTINLSDIEDIEYPINKDLTDQKIVGIYLSNYIPWDSRKFSEEMISKFKACSALNTRTFDTYDRIDDMTYMTIHDILKYAKLGYSRVTDNLTREIRFGRINIKDASIIEKFYQSQIPIDEIEIFLKWLGGINIEGFKWYLKSLPYKINFNAESSISLNLNQTNFINSFIYNSDKVHHNRYFITFGKGLNI
jgi:N-acetyl sugar amidotransferase